MLSLIVVFFFFSSRRRHTRYWRDWSSDVCSSDLLVHQREQGLAERGAPAAFFRDELECPDEARLLEALAGLQQPAARRVDSPALAHRHHRREHLEASRVGREHLDALAREA